MARVLVTGGEGFIGRHLCATLRARGDSVTVLGRPRPGVAETEQVRRIDLRDRAALDRIFREGRFDTVYHLAAATRRRARADMAHWIASAEADLLSLLTVVAAAAACPYPPRAFVRTGTLAEYGRAPLPYREDAPCYPLSAYGAAMLAGSRYLEAMQPELPFRAANARLALTYGPGQASSFLVPQLIQDITAGRRVVVQRPGDRRDLVHVEDAVEALLRLGAGRSGTFNIGSGSAPTMREVATIIAELAGPGAGEVSFGDPLGQPSELRCDTSRAEEVLGWRPAIALRDGLAGCLEGLGPTRRATITGSV